MDSWVKRIHILKLPKWSRVISEKMMNKVMRKNTHKNKKTAITTTKTKKMSNNEQSDKQEDHEHTWNLTCLQLNSKPQMKP